MDCLLLKKRLDQLKTERSNVEGLFELIENYVVPFRARFYTDLSEGSMNWRRRSLYDSTAVDANQSLASNLHSGLTNPSYRWFTLVFRDKSLRGDREATQWLEDAGDIVFMSLQESNFDLEINETFLDLTSFGTSILTEEIEENNGKFKRLIFSSVPISQGYYQYNHLNEVHYFFRELKWTAHQIKTKFPKATLPKTVQAQLDKGGTDEGSFTLVFAVYPRMDMLDKDIHSVLSAEQRPFGFKYFLEEGTEQIGEEGGYYEMPAFVPRWRKTAGSTYGHSPAMVVLSDILTLNQLVEMILKAGEKAIDPAVLTTRRGVFGDIDLRAGGSTVVASLEALKAFESTARFDVSQLSKEELQQSIRRAYFVDQLQLKESPQMTATEVQAHLELMARLIGPSLGRIQNDLHAPLVQRTFNALLRYKQLPPPPEIVRDKGVDIEFIGPMARAQKLDKVANIERWVANIGQLGEIIPDIIDNIDGDMVAQESAHYLSVPPQVIRNKAAKKKIRDERQKAIEAQQRLALAEQGSNVVKNLGMGGGNGGEQAGAEGGQAPI